MPLSPTRLADIFLPLRFGANCCTTSACATKCFSHAAFAAFACECYVNKAVLDRTLGCLLLPALLLTGCGTPAAKDFGGRWSPVNRFQSSTTELPLDRPYTYYASPMDETLRSMLKRWTDDTGVALAYRLPSDYTLFAPVAKLHTSSLSEAAGQLSSIYAAQGVSVTVEGETLHVGRVRTLETDRTPQVRATQSPSSAATILTAGIQ
jgi:hypothetical protein